MFRIFGQVTKYIIVVFFILLILFPLYYLITISLMSNEFILSDNTSFTSDGLNFQTYAEAFQTFWSALWLSFQNVFVVLLIKITVITLGAYGLTKINKYLKNLFFIIFLIISIVPEISIYFNLLRFQRNSQLRNSIVFSLSITSLFSFFSLTYTYNSFVQTSKKNQNIIKIDNLKFYEKFYYGFFPGIKLPILLNVIFTTIEVWNNFLWPTIILSGSSLNTVATWFPNLGQLPGSGGRYLNVVAAGSVISIIVPLGIYLINSRIINRSLYKSI